jgi:hypothetical protein
MKRLSIFVATLAGITLGFFGACSTGTQIAGATSETTNGDIKAQVTFSDGGPAAYARVQVVNDDGWLAGIVEGRSVVVDSGTTDSRGECTVSIPLNSRCNLQIDRFQVDGRSEGLFVRDINQQLDSSGATAVRAFRLLSYGGITGTVQALAGTPTELYLAGSTYRSQVDSNGSFIFGQVAAGSFALIACVNDNGLIKQVLTQSLDVVPDSVITLPNVQPSLERVLVDDFTLGFGQTDLGRALGDGLWYTANDKVDKGNSTITAAAVSDSQAYSGSSLRVEYVLGNKATDPWTVAGFDIGTSLQGAVYDFSSVKEISFWAKGKGSVNVTLLSKTIRTLYADSAQFYYPLQLPSTWTHITIPVDSLRLPDNAPPALATYTWQQVAGEMQTIDFTVESPYSQAGDTVELWLDDIYLEGITLDSLAQ